MGLCGSKLANDPDAQDIRVRSKNGGRNTNGNRGSGNGDDTGDKDAGRNVVEYNDIVAQAIKDLAGDIHDDEVTQAIGSAIVMVSHNGTQEQRKLLVEQALGNLMMVFNVTSNYLTRESAIRGISQLARCSRSDDHRLSATQNTDVLRFALEALELHLTKDTTAIVMHACDLLRYIIVTDADRTLAVEGRAVSLLEAAIDFSTDLSPDNDLVKSAFQVLLALGPTGENGVLISVCNALIRHFFYSSVITPALACLMSITTNPEASQRFVDLSMTKFIDQAKEVHKDNNNVRAYVNRVYGNLQYHAKQRQQSASLPNATSSSSHANMVHQDQKTPQSVAPRPVVVVATGPTKGGSGPDGVTPSTALQGQVNGSPVATKEPVSGHTTGGAAGSELDHSTQLQSGIPSHMVSSSHPDAEPAPRAEDGNSSRNAEISGQREVITSRDDDHVESRGAHPSPSADADVDTDVHANANAPQSSSGVMVDTKDIALECEE